jgi:hypothetical protein
MTGRVPAALHVDEDAVLLRRREQKRSAVERLLDWGFTPSAIARMLGCSPSWIATIRDEQSKQPTWTIER